MALYAFDGTNDDDSKAATDAAGVAADTNVFRFFSAYQGNAPSIGVDYVPGVGTRFGAVGFVVGGAFGIGWDPRLAEAYTALCANYVKGDHVIDVTGFSRGAAMALNFVSKVHENGIRQDGQAVIAQPAIRFVGVFDVVDAFGVASLGGPLSAFDPIHTLALPSSVQHCFHAMALDERRPSFVNHRIAGGYEVWFRGVHSDIGGGNNNPGLEYVALRWMYRKAIACGLPIIDANINDAAIHPEAAIKPNPFSKISLEWRTIHGSDLIHYAVGQHPVIAGEPCNHYPPSCPVETPDDERSRVAVPKVQAS